MDGDNRLIDASIRGDLMNRLWRLTLCLFPFMFACTNSKQDPNSSIMYTKEVNPDTLDQIKENMNQTTYYRVNVLFKPGTHEQLLENTDGYIVGETENIKMVTIYLPMDEIDRLRLNPNVISLELDHIVEVKPQQISWNYKKMAVPRSKRTGLTGRGVKVAVIDTGIATHPDLVVSGGHSFVSYTNSYEDDNGHGTHVAGIIAAGDNGFGIVGVAPDSRIYSLKSLDQNGVGFLSDIITAIDWAITNRMDVINVSLGTSQDSIVLKSFMVVAAAGNEGNPEGIGDTVSVPARYQSAIAVAATDEQNNRASFSATGPAIEVSAPGVDVVSTYLQNDYVMMAGTSMAAPAVTGTIALLKQAKPGISALEIREALRKYAVDLGNKGKDDWFGYGLVQTPIYLFDSMKHWAFLDIVEVMKRRWMNGTADNQFSPQVPLSRAQAAVILVRVLQKIVNAPTLTFNDINHWAREEIEIIVQHELMQGMTAIPVRTRFYNHERANGSYSCQGIPFPAEPRYGQSVSRCRNRPLGSRQHYCG
jgi:hypothetical protein